VALSSIAMASSIAALRCRAASLAAVRAAATSAVRVAGGVGWPAAIIGGLCFAGREVWRSWRVAMRGRVA